MTSGPKRTYLICNAHLDPVWLWEWEEGAAAALSTFRMAAHLCRKYKNFVFNHNEVILYEWIKEYEPALFRQIQRLVREKKWHIMGGWYLQPDCNMPSGEALIRQILIGKNYFRKYFGVEPTTAINFDSFGHGCGLPQILVKSGYDSYLFCRPFASRLKLPSDQFIWVGCDGSEVLATRINDGYNSPLGKARQKIEKIIKKKKSPNPNVVLWGVGNHGGGPSEQDVKDINAFASIQPNYGLAHSIPESYFKNLAKKKKLLPSFKEGLNPCMAGCYSSMARIKQKYRHLENELFLLEKMASVAWVRNLMSFPQRQLDEAARALLTTQFHDILPGSSIRAVEEASLRLMDHALEILSRLKARAFFALARGQKKANKDEIPVLVFNPHPFKVCQIVECEFNLADFNNKGTFTQVRVFAGNQLLASQVEKESSNLSADWRKLVAFWAELKPNCMNRFDCAVQEIDKKPAPVLQASNNHILFKTSEIEASVNTKTGSLDSYRINGFNMIGPGSFEPLVIADSPDSWGSDVDSFRKVAGKFVLANRAEGTKISGVQTRVLDSVRIIEDGPVRSVIEVVLIYEKSYICQYYKLPKFGTEIEIETRVHWNQKDQMLKLSVPVPSGFKKCIGQVACGVCELPADGDEAVSQKWLAVISTAQSRALTFINDGIYASDFSRGGLKLTLLRSPVYSGAYSAPPKNNEPFVHQDRYTPRMDQGQHIFHFWLNGGALNERLTAIDREALVKNEKPFALSFFPSGRGRCPSPLTILGDNAVQISTTKRAMESDHLIVRLFEPTGKARRCALELPCLSKQIRLKLLGFEIKTLKINIKTGTWTEVNLLEREV
jgi:alpha-mannosidase